MQFILTLYPFASLIQGNICDPTINSDTEQHLQLLLCVILGNFETTCYINPYLLLGQYFSTFGHQFRIFVPKIDCKEGGRHSPGVSIFQNRAFSVDYNLNAFCPQAQKMDTNDVSPPLKKQK